MWRPTPQDVAEMDRFPGPPLCRDRAIVAPKSAESRGSGAAGPQADKSLRLNCAHLTD